jgi:hypothetical protein
MHCAIRERSEGVRPAHSRATEGARGGIPPGPLRATPTDFFGKSSAPPEGGRKGGWQGRDRTLARPVNSRVLYRLSYLPVEFLLVPLWGSEGLPQEASRITQEAILGVG